jgi:hypothetical protein
VKAVEECPRFQTCPFFTDQETNPPRFAVLYKIRYCMHDFEHCARYRVGVKIGFEQVPLNLLPGEVEKVESLLTTPHAHLS